MVIKTILNLQGECIQDVKSSMTHSKQKLNDDKTEALITSALRISNSTSFTNSLVVGNSTVRSFFQSARNLGVTPDMRLTMAARVVKPDPNC